MSESCSENWQKNFEQRLVTQLGEMEEALRRDIENRAREVESTVRRETILASNATAMEGAILLEIGRICGEMEESLRREMMSNTRRLEAQLRATAEAVPTVHPQMPPTEPIDQKGTLLRAGRVLDSNDGDDCTMRVDGSGKGSRTFDASEIESAIRREISKNTRYLDAKIDSIAEAVASFHSVDPTSTSMDAAVMEESRRERTAKELNSDSGKSCGTPHGEKEQLPIKEMVQKLDSLHKKIENISSALGIRSGMAAGDDEEDRRRLKEKLKEALDRDRRTRISDVTPEHAVWLEYIFGICKPDQRVGKRGSRYTENELRDVIDVIGLTFLHFCFRYLKILK